MRSLAPAGQVSWTRSTIGWIRSAEAADLRAALAVVSCATAPAATVGDALDNRPVPLPPLEAPR
jgi:hypothetical protein